MLKGILIGNLGADAEVKSSNGKEFVSFRVSHSYYFTSTDGKKSSEVVWVDCLMSPNEHLLPFLKRGMQVYIQGNISLRVYSSKVDRCLKAGISIHVESLQLVGTKADPVPKEVINPDDGSIHSTTRKYMVADMIGVVKPDQYKTMVDTRGNEYFIDTLGFIAPSPNQPTE